MSTRLSDYDYELPRELIAQRPLHHRDASRMLVLDRAAERIEHRFFADLPQFIRHDDLLVLNDTRVVPARRFSDDGATEFLFVEKVGPKRWKCFVKPGRRMRIGGSATIDHHHVQVVEVLPGGERVIAFDEEFDPAAGGTMPLPPYIKRRSDAGDAGRYQTVYARTPGAVAAPTAGLHFTADILRVLPHAFVTLHVGPGTFRPVHSEDITEHEMHAERFAVSSDAAARINSATRVIAVGTTVVRVLESTARRVGRPNECKVIACEGETDIFIHPPFRFRVVDALLTNFHLPRSTLLMLVSAFAGRELILHAYAEAVRERYRFFSYGDCMLIL